MSSFTKYTIEDLGGHNCWCLAYIVDTIHYGRHCTLFAGHTLFQNESQIGYFFSLPVKVCREVPLYESISFITEPFVEINIDLPKYLI